MLYDREAIQGRQTGYAGDEMPCLHELGEMMSMCFTCARMFYLMFEVNCAGGDA